MGAKNLFIASVFSLISLTAYTQCVLSTSTLTEAQVETCLATCSCSEIIIPNGVTVNLDGDWDLTDQGDISIRIQGSGSLVLSGNGANAEAVFLTANSYIIIEDVSNTMALAQSGGSGQVRIVVGVTEYDGNDFATIVASGGINTFLPVELIHFKGKVKSGKISLYWQTASEQNNLGFAVERSDELDIWNEVGFVPGHQNSTQIEYYTFDDFTIQDVKPNIIYYRLVQTDFDNSQTYSAIISLDLSNQNLVEGLHIYPNPASTLLFFDDDLLDANYSLSIYSLSGELLTQYTTPDRANHLDISSFQTGVYILQKSSLTDNLLYQSLFVKN